MPKLVEVAGEEKKGARLVPVDDNADGYGATRNVLLGAIKGATDIGSTLLSPVDWMANKLRNTTPDSLKNTIDAIGGVPITSEQRRESLKQFFSENANPESMAFKGGELGADIAGTAGVGGVFGKAAMKAAPFLPTVAPKIATAMQSGGFSLGTKPASTMTGLLGDAAIRSGAGATVGGAASGMINPENFKEGATIGALIPPSVKAAGMAGSALRKGTGNVTSATIGAFTGTGQEAVKNAFSAGKAGNKTFLENMRGNVDFTDVLDDAKSALQKIRMERSDAYKSGMLKVSGDKSVIDINPIVKAVNNLKNMGSYKGQVINKNAAGTVDDIANKVDEWASLSPAEYHTPEGLDALKQAIGDIRDVTQYGTPARRAADSVYNSIKSQINQQAPTYSKVMKDYSDASELISEIERTLVGKDKTSVDTAMRKLQSLMRNNVNTNYGNRLNLANELESRGANILPALAGQAMSSATPRGLQGLAATGTGIYGLFNPAVLAALPFQSPRLMGELSYGLGRASGVTGSAANTASLPFRNALSIQQNPEIGGLLNIAPTMAIMNAR